MLLKGQKILLNNHNYKKGILRDAFQRVDKPIDTLAGFEKGSGGFREKGP